MLAIVIPFYKIKFFEQNLSSLAAQTNKNFSVYIGDDASPVNPKELIESYKNQIHIIYKRFDQNLGGVSLPRHWERCIRMTKDESWMMILGDDDYLSNNLVEEFYNNLTEIEQLNIRVVHFASREVYGNNEISKLYTHPKLEKSTDFFYRKFFKSSRGSLSEQIFRKDAYLKYGFREFPLGWGTDNFAWLDFTQFGQIYSINSASAYFRLSEENISRKGYEEELKQQTKIHYFSLIIFEYLQEFQNYQRLELLKYYEQMIYRAGKITFKFWLNMSRIFIKERGYIAAVKFSRRLLLILISK